VRSDLKQLLIKAVQAGLILWWTVAIAIDTNDPKLTLVTFFVAIVAVGFVGGLLTNIWDWIRVRLTRRFRSVPSNCEQLQDQRLSGGSGPVLLGNPREKPGRIGVGK